MDIILTLSFILGLAKVEVSEGPCENVFYKETIFLGTFTSAKLKVCVDQLGEEIDCMQACARIWTNGGRLFRLSRQKLMFTQYEWCYCNT